MDTAASRRRARVGAGVLTAALAVSPAAIVTRPAPAGAEGSFRALAAADGARLTIIAVNAPATNVPIDGGGPVAQASLDSLGTNQSFASQPYPGDLAVSGPGLIAGVSNGQLTPPNYPFYVSADYPIVPEQKIDQPGYKLKATAAEQEVTASAHSGGSSADNAVFSSTAKARAVSDGATVTGEASSLTIGFSAGPLTIGRLSSSASVVRQADGTLRRQSSLDVFGAKVGDTAVSITPKGITVGGADAPLGDGSAVAKALSDSGVVVKYLSARDTDNGLVSPALEVSWTGAVPGPFSPAGFVWTLGRAVARIDGGGGSGGAAPGLPAAAGDAAAPAESPAAAGGITDRAASTAASAAAAHVDPGGLSGVGAARLGDAFGGAGSSASSTVTEAALSPPPQAGSPGGVDETPAPRSAMSATPAATTALTPPEFDVTSTFGALALTLAGIWIVSRAWRSVAGRPNHNE